MTKQAKNPKTGNRYTGANMTAREAQTLDGFIRKMNNIMIQMRKRGVYVKTRTDLGIAMQATVDCVVNEGRMDEISPSSLRS